MTNCKYIYISLLTMLFLLGFSLLNTSVFERICSVCSMLAKAMDCDVSKKFLFA